MRSADVTQGYLHFSADELLEPASRIERAILEHAGMSENIKDINTQLMAVLESLNEEEKKTNLRDFK
jgi:uncharacterized protein (UPF0335 family)